MTPPLLRILPRTSVRTETLSRHLLKILLRSTSFKEHLRTLFENRRFAA